MLKGGVNETSLLEKIELCVNIFNKITNINDDSIQDIVQEINKLEDKKEETINAFIFVLHNDKINEDEIKTRIYDNFMTGIKDKNIFYKILLNNLLIEKKKLKQIEKSSSTMETHSSTMKTHSSTEFKDTTPIINKNTINLSVNQNTTEESINITKIHTSIINSKELKKIKISQSIEMTDEQKYDYIKIHYKMINNILEDIFTFGYTSEDVHKPIITLKKKVIINDKTLIHEYLKLAFQYGLYNYILLLFALGGEITVLNAFQYVIHSYSIEHKLWKINTFLLVESSKTDEEYGDITYKLKLYDIDLYSTQILELIILNFPCTPELIILWSAISDNIKEIILFNVYLPSILRFYEKDTYNASQIENLKTYIYGEIFYIPNYIK